MKSSFITILVTASVLATAAIMWCLLGSDLREAGGAYAVSPDGRWFAEICDANSKVHKKSFAVILLWDLKKYPSLRDGGSFTAGRAPTVRLEFPQAFSARDEECNLTWATNSTEFFIEFRSITSTSYDGPHRRFRYDLGANVFSLSTAPELDKTAEARHPADGRQPSRSVTNSTPLDAGSRR